MSYPVGMAPSETIEIIQILEKSDWLLAWMSYFEARKGPFGLFTDVVWEDLGFPGHAHDDFER